MPALIHTRYTAGPYIVAGCEGVTFPGAQNKMNIKIFLKCRPTVQIRGPNLWVKIKMVSRVKVTRPVSNPCLTGQSEGGGPGRVGLGGFEISRVGSSRVTKFSNLTGRVGLGQEAFKVPRVGSADPTRPDP